MTIITTVLILFSSIAAIYYSYIGLTKPDTLSPYNKAKMPRLGIQLLSLLLGAGGLLLLFPQTIVFGAALLMIHSLSTIVCYVILKDWKGAFFEFLFLQIPVFLIWAGHPLSVIESKKKSLITPKTEMCLAHNDGLVNGFAVRANEKPFKQEAIKQHYHKRQKRNYKNHLQQCVEFQISNLGNNSLPSISIESGEAVADFGINSILEGTETVLNKPEANYSIDDCKKNDMRAIRRIKRATCLFFSIKYPHTKSRCRLIEKNKNKAPIK